MADAAHCEVKLHALRRTQDGTVVSFLVHPNDTPQCLALDPLGTRYMLAVAQIGDDERPATVKCHNCGAGPYDTLSMRDDGHGQYYCIDCEGASAAVVPEGGENRDTSVTNVCYYCGETGHSAGACPKYLAKARYAAMNDMEKAAVRAALLCKDERFQKWVGWPKGEVEGAAAAVKRVCGIKSRREIATDYDAYGRFLALENRYKLATGQMAEERG